MEQKRNRMRGPNSRLGVSNRNRESIYECEELASEKSREQCKAEISFERYLELKLEGECEDASPDKLALSFSPVNEGMNKNRVERK